MPEFDLGEDRFVDRYLNRSVLVKLDVAGILSETQDSE